MGVTASSDNFSPLKGLVTPHCVGYMNNKNLNDFISIALLHVKHAQLR